MTPRGAASAVLAALLAAASCRTPESITRERVRDVERGLLRAVYLKGAKLETLDIRERMPFYRVPGASIAVMDGNRLEWSRSYGTRDVAAGEPVAAETPFQAGALSQPVAAAVALRMAALGTVDLDAEWPPRRGGASRGMSALADGGSGRPLTLRRLLAGDGGHYPQSFAGYGAAEPLPDLDDIIAGRKPAKNMPIGVDLDAAGAASSVDQDYVLAQKALESASGRPFAELARTLVFEPLGMTHSTFDPAPAAGGAADAAGHLRTGQRVEGGALRYPEAAAKGLWTIPSDLIRFAQAVMEAAQGTRADFLSPEAAQAMVTPVAGDRGLGFRAGGSGHDLRFGLRGATAGFTCELVVYPYKGQGAAVMTNSDNGFVLTEEVLRAVSAAYGWTDFKPEEKRLFRLDPSVYRQYAGRYEVSPDYALDIAPEDYYLVIRPTGQAPTKFYVENPTLFFSMDPYIRIQFLSDERGTVTGLILWQQDFKLEARKVS